MLQLREHVRLQLGNQCNFIFLRAACKGRPFFFRDCAFLDCVARHGVHALLGRIFPATGVMIRDDLSEESTLRARQLIPPITLHLSDGRTVRAWDFKQKKNLVIAFLDTECKSCEMYLHRLIEAAPAFLEREAVVLIAYLKPPPLLQSPSSPPEIIAGADVSGQSVRLYLGKEALSSKGLESRGVFLTDRYGALFREWRSSGHIFPSPDELLAGLDQVLTTCDECGTPEWTLDEF